MESINELPFQKHFIDEIEISDSQLTKMKGEMKKYIEFQVDSVIKFREGAEYMRVVWENHNLYKIGFFIEMNDKEFEISRGYFKGSQLDQVIRYFYKLHCYFVRGGYQIISEYEAFVGDDYCLLWVKGKCHIREVPEIENKKIEDKKDVEEISVEH